MEVLLGLMRGETVTGAKLQGPSKLLGNIITIQGQSVQIMRRTVSATTNGPTMVVISQDEMSPTLATTNKAMPKGGGRGELAISASCSSSILWSMGPEARVWKRDH